MFPAIGDGSHLSIDWRVSEDAIRPGDVVCYLYEGRVLIHRVVKKMAGGWVMAGDGDVDPHEIPKEAVIGLVRLPWWKRGRWGWMWHRVWRMVRGD